MLCVGELLALHGFLIIKPAASAMTSSIIKSISGIRKFVCTSVHSHLRLSSLIIVSHTQNTFKWTLKTVEIIALETAVYISHLESSHN